MSDNINHPKHYTTGKYEVIDIMEDKLTKDGFEGYLVGNVIKYITRYRHKNGVEDLKKAQWYLNKLVDVLEPPKNCNNCGNKGDDEYCKRCLAEDKPRAIPSQWEPIPKLKKPEPKTDKCRDCWKGYPIGDTYACNADKAHENECRTNNYKFWDYKGE